MNYERAVEEARARTVTPPEFDRVAEAVRAARATERHAKHSAGGGNPLGAVYARLAAAFSERMPVWALPFVTRSMRGQRGPRIVVLSLLIAMATACMGQWLARGDGEIPRTTRVALSFEEPSWGVEHRDHVVITHDEWEYEWELDAVAEAERLRTRDPEAFRLAVIRRGTGVETLETPALVDAAAIVDSPGHGVIIPRAYETVRDAAARPVAGAPHEGLRARAAAVVHTMEGSSEESRIATSERSAFNWNDTDEVRRLERILDHGLLPSVERYTSPLGSAGAVRMMGALSGLLLGLLFFVIGPVLVAVSQARESHENTLLPVMGTSLTPRGLAMGLLAGALAPVVVIAAPLVALSIGAALLCGAIAPVALLLLVVVGAGLFISAGAQLIGQFVGKRRPPGMIAMGLLGFTGMTGLIGMVGGFETSDQTVPELVLMPQAAASWLIAQGFGLTEGWAQAPGLAVGRVLVQAMGALALGVVAVRALARRLALTEGPTLTRGEGLMSMGIVIAMVCFAVQPMTQIHVGEEFGGFRDAEFADTLRLSMSIGFYVGTLFPVGLAAILVLMGRVPMRDAPPSMRGVPLRSLLLEFGAFALMHLVATSVMAGALHLGAAVDQPLSMFYVAWAWTVGGLVAIRLASLASRGVLNGFGIALSFVGIAVALVNAIELIAAGGHALVLGIEGGNLGAMAQVVGLVAIPAWLFISLKRRLGSLRG